MSFFHDIPSQIFNAGDYRRQLSGAQMPTSFYDPDNPEGVASRNKACDAALADMLEYMQKGGSAGVRVAAFDATNSTRERRKHIRQVIKESGLGAKIIFLESICDQEEVSSSSLGFVFVLFCESIVSSCGGRLSVFVMVLVRRIISQKKNSFDCVSVVGRKHSKGQTEYARLSRHGSGTSRG